MINNAISLWNNIQKTISSHALCDLSYSKLKFLLVKYFLKTYSNNDEVLQYISNLLNMLICIHVCGTYLLVIVFINIK